jgi:hypothetical protein
VTVDEQQPGDPFDPADPPDPSPPSGADAVSDTIERTDPADPAYDAGGDPLPASSFAPGLDDEALGFTSAVRHAAGCPWCGGSIPDGAAATCPSCGAALHPVAEMPDIPGLTVAPADVRRTVRDVSPEILALVAPAVGDQIALPGSRPELGPPDASVRRAMLQLELEAQRAALAAAGALDPAGAASSDVDEQGDEPGA